MTSNSDDDVYDAALRLADLGCSLFPVRGKVPAVRWGRFRTVPPDRHQIWDWFYGRDDLGIGIVFGPVSQHLCARDFDDGASFYAWVSSHSTLAKELPIAISRRGGHVYFRSSTAHTTKLDDGELRAGGSYVVAPPSMHPSGSRYVWQRPLISLPPFVDPVDAGLAPARQPAAKGSSQDGEGKAEATALGDNLGATLEAAIAKAIRATLPRRFGERYDLIWEFARRLKAIPDLHGLTGRDVLAHAHDWFRSALPFIGTKEWRVTSAAFLSAWSRITHPFTDGTLTTCLAVVDATPPSPVALRYVCDPVAVRLVGLCERLQLLAGCEPFFLSTEACHLFGLPHRKQLSRRIERLRADSVLERLTIGNSIQRKASTYRYLPTIERTAIQ